MHWSIVAYFTLFLYAIRSIGGFDWGVHTMLAPIYINAILEVGIIFLIGLFKLLEET